MASLGRHRTGGFRVEFFIYLSTGDRYLRTIYRRDKRDAENMLGLATRLEALLRQQVLTSDLAITFQHEGLLRPEDLQRLFPSRLHLAFDRTALLTSYTELCRRQCTSQSVIAINVSRAERLLDTLGDLSSTKQEAIEAWQNDRLRIVSRKTVNLEQDVLRQLLDLCVRHHWRLDNPARQVRKLPWKLSRLPQALTYGQIQEALRLAAAVPPRSGPTSLAAQRYRLLVAGIFFGLRRGELQHLVHADTNGRQVYVQGKTLPDGRHWLPKDREARVIHYLGIERPIALVFGEWEGRGYVFSPDPDRQLPFHADSLSQSLEKLLKALNPGLSLHSLRHTFATWRLEMGDPMIRVQNLMGHADANTLLRYTHVQVDPMADLLALLP
jgi:site-specific recombinase XerD